MFRKVIIFILIFFCISSVYAEENKEFLLNGIRFSGGCRVVSELPEDVYTDKDFAIVLNFDEELNMLNLFNENGEIKKYIVDGNKSADVFAHIRLLADKKTAQDRVIKYTEANGLILSVELTEPSKESHDRIFSEKNKLLGDIIMDAETKVIDAIYFSNEDNELILTSLECFVDGVEYTAYAYGIPNKNNAFSYVIVTDSGGCDVFYTENFFVVCENPKECDEGYILRGFKSGEQTELVANRDAMINGVHGIEFLKQGDVFLYTVDNRGNINRIDVLITAEVIGVDRGFEKVLENTFSRTVIPNIPDDRINWTNSWSLDLDSMEINSEKTVTRILYGPVAKIDYDSLELCSIGITDGEKIKPFGNGNTVSYSGLFTDLTKNDTVGGVVDITFDSNTNVYTYNPTVRRIEKGLLTDVKCCLKDMYYCNNGTYIAWDGFYDEINGEIEAEDVRHIPIALVKLEDGYATDVFVILAE